MDDKQITKIQDLSINSDDDTEITKWGFNLKELYKLALSFYKEKSGKAVHLTYEENLKLVAFCQQVKFGPFQDSQMATESLGMFDMIGKDRRHAWENLGQLSKYQAMEGFIDLLDRLCPTFRPFVEAIKKDNEEKLKKKIEMEKKQASLDFENAKLERERQEEERKREEEEIKKRQLQDLLNQQTYLQFRSYAEKQFPGNPEQQAILIKQLQNEHYFSYIQQLQIYESERSKANEVSANDPTSSDNFLNEKEANLIEEKENNDSQSDAGGEYAVIQPANLWTRHDIKEFKREVIANGKGDGILRVSHGETITVRVPTLEGGSSLFWEFATDNYDIGFGVYFEWGKPDTNEVSVHISESDDDDDILEEEEIEEEITCVDDLECGSSSQLHVPTSAQNTSNYCNRPPLSIIIPVYRRECQNEVYAGSHNYPGQGVYLLKFDNSFSLWRSKTLYYRIFYTR